VISSIRSVNRLVALKIGNQYPQTELGSIDSIRGIVAEELRPIREKILYEPDETWIARRIRTVSDAQKTQNRCRETADPRRP
jgi:hypothetical protein